MSNAIIPEVGAVRFFDGDDGFAVEAPWVDVLRDRVQFEGQDHPRPLLSLNDDDRQIVLTLVEAADTEPGKWFENCRDAIRDWSDADVAERLYIPIEVVPWMRATSHGWYVTSVLALADIAFDGDFGKIFTDEAR